MLVLKKTSIYCKMKNLIGIEDLSIKEIDELIDVASDIIENREKYAEKCKGKILATLFFEPSTRTRLSFESAMLSLGGQVLGFSSANSSSAAKGESVGDTIKTVSAYADIIAMRHPKEGAPVVAAMKADVPIINAGDGGHNHPTQTLTDLLTISKEKGRLDNLTVGLCGDLKFGRTVHSLMSALSRYKNIKFVLISPDELKIPDYIKTEVLEKNNIEYCETADLEKYMNQLDILYMTRIQKERFSDESDYIRLKDSYILNKEKLQTAKQDLCILHPLPRVNEISVEVDEDPRACYFRQVKYGRFIRMALILKLLESNNMNGLSKGDSNITINVKENEEILEKLVNVEKCKNPRCITSVEQELDQVCILTDRVNGVYRCKYCESRVK